MLKTMIICIFIAEISRDLAECKPPNRNSYILHYNGSLEDSTLSELNRAGYKFEKEIISFDQEVVYYRSKRSVPMNRKRRAVTVTDANWSDQWHLICAFLDGCFCTRDQLSFLNEAITYSLDDPGHTPSMGVYNVWDKGFTGQGVNVAIIDDGIDVAHVDLVDNYDASLSYDFISDDNDPSHVYANDGHGTNCAGIDAAAKNEQCVIGIAYGAKMPAIRLLDNVRGATVSEEASALIHQLENIDIYSNSWGPTDDGAGYDSTDGISSIQEAALLKGVTEGRNGKGAIYTWAAGNGGDNFDDCNIDGYSNTIYTISVNSLAPDTAPAWYAEECTAVLAATYGGDDTQDRIATTDPGNQCIDDFQGTSASCPVAAGIIALVLQANPQLSWRDIQHMIVENSTSIGLTNANFYSNAVGKQVSLSHCFGLLNAEAMVDAAPTWLTVPTQVRCEGASQNVFRSSTALTSVVSTWTNDDCLIQYLEHVYISINFQSLYRESTAIYLVSPGGTESRILRERPNDIESDAVSWKFMSVHTWGENPSGTWTLRMDSSISTMDLNTWSLTFYGTVTDPLQGTQEAGTLGGTCCASTECSVAEKGCDKSYYICVNCGDNYHAIGGLCVEGEPDVGESNAGEKDNKVVIVGATIGSIAGMAVISIGVFVLVTKNTNRKATGSVAPAMTGQTQTVLTVSACLEQGTSNETYGHNMSM